MNLHTLSAYIQVVILKHVIEINEDVVMKTLRRAIYASHMWITFLLPVDGKFSRKPEYDHWKPIIYPHLSLRLGKYYVQIREVEYTVSSV